MKWFKKLREKFEWKKKIRRIEVSRAGKWFLVLTIALGVVSVASGNNVIYLIESLLLSGLILSGILSEQAISAVRVEFIRLQAKALSPTHDYISITNQTRRSLFCIEIGEWRDGEFISLCFIPYIGPKKVARVRSEQVLSKRGSHDWDGFAIATSYPFGFARKIKVVRTKGTRLVWPPQKTLKKKNNHELNTRVGRKRSELEIVEGELRAYDINDDARLIIAKQSAKGGVPLVRNRRSVMKEPEINFDLRTHPSEAALEKTAAHFYVNPDAELVVVDAHTRKKYRGQKLALNTLAHLPPLGDAP